MKNRLMLGLLSAAVVLVFTACTADDPEFSSATGTLQVKLGIDHSVKSANGSRTEYSDVTVDDLTLKLVSADGSVAMSGSPADFAADKKIKVGDYTLEAVYGSSEEDGFGVPYFYGSQEISITENEVTEVDLTAALANSMVSVTYTEAFKNYFTSYSASVLSAAGRTTEYANDEVRPAYIAAGDAKIFVSVTKPNGKSATLQPASFKAEAKHHYTVTLDVNNGAGSGDPVLSVSFDDSVDQETVEVILSDELMSAPAPSITCSGFTPGEAIHVLEGTPYNGDLKMTLIAKGMINEAPMVTVSSQLTSAGWPADLDLVKATPAQQSQLAALGLNARGLFKNPEKMAVLDFSELCKHLSYVEGASNVNRFTVYVKDMITKVCEPVTLEIIVDKMELQLSNGYMLEGDDHFTVDLTYAGTDIKSNVALQYLNTVGNWVTTDYTFSREGAASAVKSRSGSTLYHLTVPVAADAVSPFKVRVVYKGNVTSNTETITPVARDFAISTTPANVWATYADVTVNSATAEHSSADIASTATVLVSAGGAAYTTATVEKNGATLRVKGLTPGTAYNVKAYYDGDKNKECLPIAITTESALQLPNGNMESWTEVRSGGATGTFWREYAVGDGSVWGTNNPMTTSADQGLTYGYTNASGTKPTTDAHAGSNAALIRSVGWGNGSTAAPIGAKMTYGDAGLLHLGESRTARPEGYSGTAGFIGVSDLNCGYAFASRPSSISFWYKYSPKNSSDNGYVEYWVKDAAGNLLASGNRTLGSASSYTQVSLPLNYAAGAPKAAKIYVMFRSCNDESLLSQSKNNFTSPPNFNLSDGEYVGSQLYIDDIVLNY